MSIDSFTGNIVAPVQHKRGKCRCGSARRKGGHDCRECHRLAEQVRRARQGNAVKVARTTAWRDLFQNLASKGEGHDKQQDETGI